MYLSVCVCGFQHSKDSQNVESPTEREKRELPAVLQTGIRISGTLASAYLGGTVGTIVSGALNLINTIPAIIDFFNGDNIKDEIRRGFHEIHDNLNTMQKEITSVGAKVEKLSKKLDISIVQNRVAEAGNKIRDCHANFLLYTESPSSKAEKDRLVKCDEKFKYTREMGDILTGNTLTFLHNSLFDQLRDSAGYCNASQISHVFNYILGLYIEGCTASVAAETLKYDGSSGNRRTTCERTLHNFTSYLSLQFNNCAVETCQDIAFPIKSIVQTTQISAEDMYFTLRKTFPWFEFTILLFRNDKEPNIEFLDGQMNRLVVKNPDKTYSVVLWLPSSTKGTTDGVIRFGIEFDRNTLQDSYNGLHLAKTGSNRETLSAFHQKNEELFEECKSTWDDTRVNSAAPTTVNLLLATIEIGAAFVTFLMFMR